MFSQPRSDLGSIFIIPPLSLLSHLTPASLSVHPFATLHSSPIRTRRVSGESKVRRMIRVAKDMETDDGTERDRKGEACRLFPFRYFLGSVVIIILALQSRHIPHLHTSHIT